MKSITFAAMLSLVALAGCLAEPTPVQEKVSLTQARAGFKTIRSERPSQRGLFARRDRFSPL
jgi:hypothetical protein